ncbi:matrixin family metalloprotease [Chryseobacterium salviniae]|uniref:Matrixin family metalloprotease n=1 Tax=Chryseobacterium salviniae TaxID=3101750 RepID=A0ABU6HPF3_9FLAO|nr:matrixin family metalloprotease [Chryseobacterium sp. T9W2-O]MEC3874828.1 matrixin family metalloprotease [Chryseobacterium sp. T9W2-O]
MKEIIKEFLRFRIILFYILLLYVLSSCSEKKEKAILEKEPITILVQPFKDMNSGDIELLVKEIKKVYPQVKELKPIDLPKNSYYQPRDRYRADSIISFLSKNTKKNFVTIGLTTKDISATKGNIKDFGILGLGFRPGTACIASSFRLNKENRNEQLFKVAIHELGHTQGLKHCPEKSCFMRDAEGKNLTNEETEFCKKCRQILINKNWKFR